MLSSASCPTLALLQLRWSTMLDIRRLRVLHAVSSYGSVTAAATALGYSAPAVSQQLAALEREVGMRLTERAGRGIELTPAGATIVPAAWAALAHAAPKVQLELTEMEPDESLPAVLRGETDVAVAHEYDLLP